MGGGGDVGTEGVDGLVAGLGLARGWHGVGGLLWDDVRKFDHRRRVRGGEGGTGRCTLAVSVGASGAQIDKGKRSVLAGERGVHFQLPCYSDVLVIK